MTFIYVISGIVTTAFIIVLSLLLNAHKRIKELCKENEHQMSRHAETCQKYGRQIEKRNEVIKRLLHERFEPETLAFFIDLADPSSHIPDSVFEKVDAYQDHIVKKKKEG